jgi:hypothetical protein
MKKVLLSVLAVAFLAGAAFAGDGSKGQINVEVGVDVAGNVKYGNVSYTPETGFSLGAEYLYPVLDILKVGIGVQYLTPRKIDSNYINKLSYIPVYVAVQLNPITTVPEIFFRGNLGCAIFNMSDSDHLSRTNGGLTWGLGAGYEFPFGLFIEAIYSFYYSSTERDSSASQVIKYDFTYSKLGLNVGYKFNL